MYLHVASAALSLAQFLTTIDLLFAAKLFKLHTSANRSYLSPEPSRLFLLYTRVLRPDERRVWNGSCFLYLPPYSWLVIIFRQESER